ncbi:MAG: thioesterase family protein [Pseudomonadota bacterium]
MYSKRFLAGWSEMDFNGHMKNTAFLDKAADVRLMFLAEKGFPTAEFLRLRMGPVVVRDEIDYRKEVDLLQEIDVTLALAGMSPDGSRWIFHTEVLRDGKACARMRNSGAWIHLDFRKLVAPPAELLAALESLAKTADFEILRGVVRGSVKPPAESNR